MATSGHSSSSYSNFRDPLGLLVRMLKSGNKTAYFTLFREGVALVLKPIDYLLSGFEKRRIQKKVKSDLPVILIVGGSRSGTTLLYQTLVHYLPVSYFNNLNLSFPKSPITSGLLFNRFLKKKDHGFKNFFGSVSGLGGPNDGFHIWNRWFGQDRYAIKDKLSDEVLFDLSNFLNSWNAAFQKPLLNKNNRNSLAIRHFEKAMPEKMIYIFIRRNPVYVVQSLIESRLRIQGDKKAAWGIGAKDTIDGAANNTDPYSYIDDICDQVYQVEQKINTLLEEIPSERKFYLSYESLCENPKQQIERISSLIFDQKRIDRNIDHIKPFKNTNIQRLPDEEFNRIKKSINSLYGTVKL